MPEGLYPPWGARSFSERVSSDSTLAARTDPQGADDANAEALVDH